jgi:hypothetical protein
MRLEASWRCLKPNAAMAMSPLTFWKHCDTPALLFAIDLNIHYFGYYSEIYFRMKGAQIEGLKLERMRIP